MIIKKHLPHRSSREGFLPDRIMLRFCRENASTREEAFRTKNESAHWHLATDGTVTEFLPLSSAATLPRGKEDGIPLSNRCIVILVQSENDTLGEGQTEPLIRLLKRAQKEVYRIYGQPLPFRHDTLLCTQSFPKETLLAEGSCEISERRLYRVQTGVYHSLRDAEDHLERLGNAGIAGYITEIGVT